jgi:hypothetical protein
MRDVGVERGRLTRAALIAFGALGGAVSWSIHLIVIYALVPIACLMSSGLLIHLMTLLFGAVAGATIYVSWIEMRRGRVGGDVRWIGAAGVVLNAMFLLAIILEGIAVFVVDPCL